MKWVISEVMHLYLKPQDVVDYRSPTFSNDYNLYIPSCTTISFLRKKKRNTLGPSAILICQYYCINPSKNPYPYKSISNGALLDNGYHIVVSGLESSLPCHWIESPVTSYCFSQNWSLKLILEKKGTV